MSIENMVNNESSSEKKFVGGEIMLILMFRGQFLQDNIGHEIINMFAADDGNNYIYVNPYGTFDKCHSGKIEAILLGRYAGDNCIEIIAKAEDLEEIVKVKENKDKLREEQIKSCSKISYGGKNIVDIFNRNEEQNKQQYAWVSFRAGKYRKANREEKIYITDTKNDTDTEIRKNKVENINQGSASNAPQIHFSKRSLKAYYSKDTKTDTAYQNLHKLIQNEKLWEDVYKPEDEKIKLEDAHDEYRNFLKLIRKENDELSFSNLFAHYLSPRFGLMKAFAKEILKLEDFEDNFEILREWENIDLLIEDKNHVIVIENKIKSKINGTDPNDRTKSQLEKYRKTIENKKQITFRILCKNFQ